MAKRRKKKHMARIVVPVILVIIAVSLFFGRNAIIGGIKAKAVETVAKKLLEEQLHKAAGESGSSIDVSEIVDNMDKEDIQKAADIAEKYVSSENIGEYVEMVKDGRLSELKQQVQGEITEADKQELMELYEKYKDQIPLE